MGITTSTSINEPAPPQRCRACGWPQEAGELFIRDGQGYWRHDGDCRDGDAPEDAPSLIAHDPLGTSRVRQFGTASATGPDPRARKLLEAAGVVFTRTGHKEVMGHPIAQKPRPVALPEDEKESFAPAPSLPAPAGEEDPVLEPIQPTSGQRPLSARKAKG